EYVAGTFTSITNDSDTWALDTWYYVRFRINSTDLKMKRWAGTLEDEPGTWDIETTDASLSADGWAGAFAFATRTYEWDFFSAATGGATALPPIEAVVLDSVSVQTQPLEAEEGFVIGGPPTARVLDTNTNPVSGVSVVVSL